ncbi:hypothetical protein [Agrobacterium vitis]|uniref:hypothetical protein n=1 Tax=Agrobacterium vitis TaxID=373 RepID=UPI0018D2154C|nr:hypothetical protein [Agrobacterium vitis]
MLVASRVGNIVLIEGADHWIKLEQPAELAGHFLGFAKEAAATSTAKVVSPT